MGVVAAFSPTRSTACLTANPSFCLFEPLASVCAARCARGFGNAGGGVQRGSVTRRPDEQDLIKRRGGRNVDFPLRSSLIFSFPPSKSSGTKPASNVTTGRSPDRPSEYQESSQDRSQRRDAVRERLKSLVGRKRQPAVVGGSADPTCGTSRALHSKNETLRETLESLSRTRISSLDFAAAPRRLLLHCAC